MKRLSRNDRGEVSYGPKWQNTELENEDDLHSPAITTAHEDSKDQIPKGKRFEVSAKNGEMMYVAALEGDWVAAEVLLERDRNLAFDYITEEGDRALHVAAAMKHKEFVKKLVGRMSDKELVLRNGHGYTACCYAAISGDLEIARLIIGNRPNLITAHDDENVTPLRKAALQGNGKMLKFLLRDTKNEDLSREEWFDLLLVAIRGEMFGVAIDILGKNGSVATMASEEGTALHLMARVDASKETDIISLLLEWPMKIMRIERDGDHGKEYYRKEFRELIEKLWGEMKKMENDSLVELIKKPVHIIHEAAKAGQVKIITMLARHFPALVWVTDCDGYTIFHLAVMYRRIAVFNLFHQVEAMLGLRTAWQDRQGNNILHLAAAKPAAVIQMKLPPAHQMQKELKFFKAVKKIVPPSSVMMRNGEGVTPGELFSQTHNKLLKDSEIWMINKSDSLMLIATILLTVVFAAAFAVPGGFSQGEEPVPGPAPAPAPAPAPGGDAIEIGEPVLAKKPWFLVFVISELISLVFSLLSIMIFQYIMTSRFAQEEFLFPLPLLQWVGFQTMFISLAGASLAFMAAISLYSMKGTNALKWVGIGILLLYGSVWALRELTSWNRHTSDRISDSEDSLFEQKLVKKRFNIFWKNIYTRMENILMSWNKFHQRERNPFFRIGAKKSVHEAAQGEQMSNLM